MSSKITHKFKVGDVLVRKDYTGDWYRTITKIQGNNIYYRCSNEPHKGLTMCSSKHPDDWGDFKYHRESLWNNQLRELLDEV